MISTSSGFRSVRLAGALCAATATLFLASCAGGAPTAAPTAPAGTSSEGASQTDGTQQGSHEGSTGSPAAGASGSPETGSTGAAGGGSSLDLSGDPAQVCVDLVGGSPATDLSPKPDNVTTHYGPAVGESGLHYGAGFREAVGGVPITCLIGTPQSEWAVQYGYATYGAGQADTLRAWAEGQAGVTKTESDGRTVYSWPNADPNMTGTLHLSVGDSDAVFATGDKVWDRIVDL